MQQTDAHIMSSIEVLWNEANAIDVVEDTQPVKPDNNGAEKAVSYDLGEIGQRVEEASIIDHNAAKPVAADDAINRIKHATTINPSTPQNTHQNTPQAMPKDIDMQSPEYMFGEAFTNLVRHIVIDYLDKSVEPIIREAITSEIKQIAKKPKSKNN